MAKRARGTTTRPGQRRPMQRPPVRPATTAPRTEPRPATLTAEEEARAAELEATIVAEEKAAEGARESTRQTRSQRGTIEATHRAPSTLAVAASNEYAYVARDLRRVVKVGGTLFVVLAVLWVYHELTGATL